MSRAVNVDAAEAHVISMCAKHKAAISSIETLPSGATRVVLKNADDAVIVARAYGNKVLTGAVARTPMRLLHNRPVEVQEPRRPRRDGEYRG